MGLKNVATRLIERHGIPATLLRPGPGTTDEFGGYAPGPDTEIPILAVSAAYDVELQALAGALLAVGDQRLLVASDVTPETTDRIRFAVDTFDIVRVAPVAPAGVALFYEVQARDV